MPHARRDAASQRITLTCWNFYSHTSYEAWLVRYPQVIAFFNFYPHASYEAWPVLTCRMTSLFLFLLTRLIRGMTRTAGTFGGYGKFLLTRLIRGMTSPFHVVSAMDGNFYSHASYEAWLCRRRWCFYRNNFYSHASYEAWRWGCQPHHQTNQFLLTRLIRGMTRGC